MQYPRFFIRTSIGLRQIVACERKTCMCYHAMDISPNRKLHMTLPLEDWIEYLKCNTSQTPVKKDPINK